MSVFIRKNPENIEVKRGWGKSIYTLEEMIAIRKAEGKEWRDKNPHYMKDYYCMKKYGSHICHKCGRKFPLFYIRTQSKRRSILEGERHRTESIALIHFKSLVSTCTGQNIYNKSKRTAERVKLKINNGGVIKLKKGSVKRKYVDDYKLEHPCILCGEASIECLDFHHRDPKTKLLDKKGKTITISKICQSYSMEILKAEIIKCEVLCANCHRKAHFGTVVLLLNDSMELRW